MDRFAGLDVSVKETSVREWNPRRLPPFAGSTDQPQNSSVMTLT
jgi:hypothetical protein